MHEKHRRSIRDGNYPLKITKQSNIIALRANNARIAASKGIKDHLIIKVKEEIDRIAKNILRNTA